MPIDRIEIENFKSIRKATVEIKPINVLVGPNGVGKSNFIGFFLLLKNIYEQNLRNYVGTHGRADAFLHFGRSNSEFTSGEIYFRNNTKRSNSYRVKLTPDNANFLFIEKESSGYNRGDDERQNWDYKTYDNLPESIISQDGSYRNDYLREYFNEFNTFHFHDTSRSSKLKQTNLLNDNRLLKSDGSNLASFLYFLSIKHPFVFKLIEKTIQSIAPYFEGFDLEPDKLDETRIDLVWKEFGSNQYFNAYNLSDGTLRFIALTTLLMQPKPPKTIIIDEPELGLHPSAIKKLAALIETASIKSQVIISTQSVTLLNEFSPEDIIVVDREEAEGKMSSKFTRLDDNDLKAWLDGYSMGEIWEKNIIGGKP